MGACCSVSPGAGRMPPGGSASPRQRTAWRRAVGAHPRWGGGSPVTVWGDVAGDGTATAARSVPLGTAKIPYFFWIVCAQRSAASTRWLGEVLWVSPGRMPTLRYPGRLLLGEPTRFRSIGSSRAHRADRGRRALYADLLLFCADPGHQAAHQCSWWCRYVQQKLWFVSRGQL